MKKIITLGLIALSFCVTAQEKLNNYKYVLIPAKYGFQNTENQNNVNMLLKYKFQQMGFETYLDTDELPREMKTNSCSYIKPLVITNNTIFKTILHIQVLNCDNDILFETKEGSSRTKSDKISYNEAMRIAISSFGDYRLKYEKNDELTKSNQPKTLVELQAEIVALKKEKKSVVEMQPAVIENESHAVDEIIIKEEKNHFLAIKTKTGYKLLSVLTKKEIYYLYTTKLKNVYLLKNKSGIIYKKGEAWIYENVNNEQSEIEYLNLKFE